MKLQQLPAAMIVALAILFLSLKTSDVSVSSDHDFESVKIGNQTWMLQNLDVDHFRNGDPIPQVTSKEEWEAAGDNGEPAWCYYENDPANGEVYGKLYNWHAVTDQRGLAPEGWKIPSDYAWKTLEMSLGMSRYQADDNMWRGDKEGQALKAKKGWKNRGGGKNSSGFSALPGGDRSYDGSFHSQLSCALYWTSSVGDQYQGWARELYWDFDNVRRFKLHKGCGLSVRCLKED